MHFYSSCCHNLGYGLVRKPTAKCHSLNICPFRSWLSLDIHQFVLLVDFNSHMSISQCGQSCLETKPCCVYVRQSLSLCSCSFSLAMEKLEVDFCLIRGRGTEDTTKIKGQMAKKEEDQRVSPRSSEALITALAGRSVMSLGNQQELWSPSCSEMSHLRGQPFYLFSIITSIP